MKDVRQRWATSARKERKGSKKQGYITIFFLFHPLMWDKDTLYLSSSHQSIFPKVLNYASNGDSNDSRARN